MKYIELKILIVDNNLLLGELLKKKILNEHIKAKVMNVKRLQGEKDILREIEYNFKPNIVIFNLIQFEIEEVIKFLDFNSFLKESNIILLTNSLNNEIMKKINENSIKGIILKDINYKGLILIIGNLAKGNLDIIKKILI